MSQPTARIQAALVKLFDRPFQQPFQHLELQTHPCFAVSRRCEAEFGQLRQMRAGSVSGQDLQKENLHRSDRIER